MLPVSLPKQSPAAVTAFSNHSGPLIPEFAAYKVAESTRRVDVAVAQEVPCAVAPVVKGKHCRLYKVFYVYECDVLRFQSCGEVDVAAYALRHHEVVFLPRAVHSRGAQHYEGEALHGVERLLGLEPAT